MLVCRCSVQSIWVASTGPGDGTRDRTLRAGLSRPSQIKSNLLVSYAKRRFTVLGQVNHPGNFDMPDTSPGGIDLLEAIGIAGGYTRTAARGGGLVCGGRTERGEQVFRVDGKRVARGQGGGVKVEPGDTIRVGEAFSETCGSRSPLPFQNLEKRARMRASTEVFRNLHRRCPIPLHHGLSLPKSPGRRSRPAQHSLLPPTRRLIHRASGADSISGISGTRSWRSFRS